jgi:hypothetical protein
MAQSVQRLGYRIDDREIGVRFFSCPYVQTGSVAHPASYTMGGTWKTFSAGLKRPESEADHLPQTSAELIMLELN